MPERAYEKNVRHLVRRAGAGAGALRGALRMRKPAEDAGRNGPFHERERRGGHGEEQRGRSAGGL